MAISAQLIKELREKSGAGMLDCKNALSETNGDLEEAIIWLRKKGLASAGKKAGRTASEGLVACHHNDNYGVLVEINSETDFVAKNEQFKTLCDDIAKIAFDNKIDDVELLKSSKMADGKEVQEAITNAIAVIGENINLRRISLIEAPEGAIITSYIHNAVDANKGRIGILVAIKTKDNSLAKQIAMHIAAAKPESLTIDELDPVLIEREKDVASEQSRASGKPENIIEKMVEGRVRKFYEEVVLLEQTFVIDGKTKIKDALKANNAEIYQFSRFNLGEGIEKKEDNFAEEVAKMAGKA